MNNIFSLNSLVLIVSFLAISPELYGKKTLVKESVKNIESEKDDFAIFNDEVKKELPQKELARDKHYDFAQSLIKDKQISKAIDYLWQNIEYLSGEGMSLLAELHRLRSEYQKQLRVSLLLKAKNENNHVPHYYIGDALINTGKIKEGIESLNHAIELNPKYEPSYLSLISYYEKKKNNYELRAIYEDLVKNIGARAIYLSKLCQINHDDGMSEAGKTYCEKAIQADKKNPLNHVYLGLILNKLGNEDKGGKILKDSALKFANSDFAQFEYAEFLAKNKNYTEAYLYYSNAIKINTKNYKVYTGAAEAAVQILKNDVAYEHLKKACNLSRESAVAARRIVIELRKLGSDNATINKFENLSFNCTQR